MFSTLPKTSFDILFKFILSLANAFNLDQSKILLLGKGLRQCAKTHEQGVSEY